MSTNSENDKSSKSAEIKEMTQSELYKIDKNSVAVFENLAGINRQNAC